jgi:hypothetical protein
VKRVNYYTHQFLRESEFRDEQNYHLSMRRLHNRLFHSWGIVEGLEVRRRADRELTITPGIAIDSQGREIVLAEPVTRDLSSFNRDSHTFVTIAYAERSDEDDHQRAGGVEGYSRISEIPEISERKHEPPTDGTVLTLARVHLNDVGHVGHVDMGPSIRRRAVAPSPAAGWVRLPFKPSPLPPVRIGGRLVRVDPQDQPDQFEFIIDEATAYCDDRGARGSMAIPVPPSAVKVTALRVAGTSNGPVTIHLHRTGWNPSTGAGGKEELVRETLIGPSLSREIHVDAAVEDWHALSLSLIADDQTQIWMVAARFE